MRVKNSIVYRILACFIISVLLLGYLPAPANAKYKTKDLAVSEITQTSVKLTWTDRNNADHYKVYKDEILCTTVEKNEAQIIGLLASTEYRFTVLAVKNNDVVGDLSDVLIVTTLPAAPAGLTASTITQTTATLTWTATTGATSYKVYKNGILYPGQTTSPATITGLTAGTAYNFTVSAVNAGGEGPQSTASAVLTLPAVPAAPTGLTASAITQTTAILTWTAATGATSYKVYKDGILYPSPTTSPATITGLTAGTTYSFKVSAVNAGAEGPQSTALSVTTALAIVNLRTASPFAILSGETITNTGATIINGDVGLHPGSAFTGQQWVFRNGALHLADDVALAAKNDLVTAYTDAAGRTPVTRIPTELGGKTITPGTYDSQSGTFEITGTLTLDAQGDPNAVFIFKMASTLVTATYSNVELINGAQSSNVFWQVGSSATLETYSHFVGCILASTSIQAKTGVTVQGQLMAQTGSVTLDNVNIQNGNYVKNLEVLEVQPGTSYDLTTSTSHDLTTVTSTTNILPGYTVNLTQMSMPEFISKVDEINGKYDVVYIGNNTSGKYTYGAYTSGQYIAQGAAPTNLPQGGLNNGTGTSKEYYSDNDITKRRAKTLQSFIDSKQLTIFDEGVFGLGVKYKLYNEFTPYVDNTAYPNFVTTNTANISTAFSGYSNASVAKRPLLQLNSQPVQYGVNANYSSDRTLGYNFDINNQTDANNMTVKLYIDLNGDGIFKALGDDASTSELLAEQNNMNSDKGYAMNYNLSDKWVGLQPWKLELTDNSTGAKSYILGATAFKATNSNDVLHVRLLQLKPTGSTFSINSLRSVDGQNLLSEDNVYNIDVTEMNVTDFNNAYAQATPATVTATVNGVSTQNVKTALNGNYDMVIMGFADTYGNNDLTNAKALNALQSFIDSKQSVMFTHDTLTFQVNSNPSWGYNITQNFRKIVGQQRYYRTAPDATRYYDLMPDSQVSYGFTNLTLARNNNGINGTDFQTTTQTHKINDNLVTQFPFVLGDIPVSATHFQYYQLDLEDENVVPVYSYTNDSGSTIFNQPGDGRNNYYTYTKGSITYSGTGHSQVDGLPEEKMFVNTMLKASRGANHAPTLVVNGITEGMNIANTLPSIGFNFTATDIDAYDQYLNADVYLSTSTDGTNFGAYENVKHFSDAQRVQSGVAQAVSISTVNSTIKAYKVKVTSSDGYNAVASQEIKLICQPDPSIAVSSFTKSGLIGDSIDIPVNLTATGTVLNETFKLIKLKSSVTKMATDGSSTPIGTPNITNYDDLTFSPTPDLTWINKWTNTPKSYALTFDSAGTYDISNQLTYTAYNGVPPIPANLTGQPRSVDQSFSINILSGTINGQVLDPKGKGISGVPLTINGTSYSTTTGASGSFSFTGLSSGSYTVSVTVPAGRTILGSLSQVASVSVANNIQTLLPFTMSGDLIINPSIKSRSGEAQLTTIRDVPLQTTIKFDLTRAASFLNVDLTNSLGGSTTNVALTKASYNDQEIKFNVESGNPGKILPSSENTLFPTTFPSGNYKIEATVTIAGVTMQAPQTFTVSLTQQMSAKDANSGSEEIIVSVPSPLTVHVVRLISNPSIKTQTLASQISILKNVPLQTVVGFYLSLPATFLKVDLSNSLGSTMNVVISEISCNNGLTNQTINFGIDGTDPEKLIPSNTNTPFPSGAYTIKASITLNGVIQEGQSFTILLTDQTSGKDSVTGNVEDIDSVSLPLTVNVGTAPPLH